MGLFRRKKRQGHGDLTRKYYVYYLYITHNGQEVILYAGKGSSNRVTDHEKILRSKLKRGVRLDAKERLMVLVMDLGYRVDWRIVERDLTEDEAFNLEHEVIEANGLRQRGNWAYAHRIVDVA